MSCRVWYPAGKLRPRRNRQKSFESLPFSLKGHFLKISCMYKLHYSRHIEFILKEPPIWKFFFCSAGSDTPQNNFEIWISPRIRTRIRKCFRVWIRGPYGVDSWKKTRGQKSRATVPLSFGRDIAKSLRCACFCVVTLLQKMFKRLSIAYWKNYGI
jgi:hypothetical protein